MQINRLDPTPPQASADVDFGSLFALGEHSGVVYLDHEFTACDGSDEPGNDGTHGCDYCNGDAQWRTCTAHRTCGRCQAILTPRSAYLLHVGARGAASEITWFFTGVERADLNDADLDGDLLPVAALRWLAAQDDDTAGTWIGALIYAAERFAGALEAGALPTPASAADELIAHLTLDTAFAYYNRHIASGATDEAWSALPAEDDRDTDQSWLATVIVDRTHFGAAGGLRHWERDPLWDMLEPGRWFLPVLDEVDVDISS